MAAPTHAIILFGSGDPETNTTAPGTALAVNGWNLQGYWGSFQGTPIGPHHFISATHVGGTVGQVFTFQNISYTTISASRDTASDLIIWEIAGTFPEWALLYDGTTETGLDLVVFGRGVIRGAEVRVNGVLKGWQWGALDGRLRWGQNRVSSIVADPDFDGSVDPQLLVAQFNSNATVNEAQLGVGDSSGAAFIQENGVWRLAGINKAVDGLYNTNNTGAGFEAAIFDQGGLYLGQEGNWTFITDHPTDQPGSFYATRIKARLSWIQSVLASPLTPILLEASVVTGPYNPVSGASVDTTAKTIQFTPSAGTHFYRIENISTEIIESVLSGGTLTLQYQ